MNCGEITLMRGLPGSGKTTLARSMVMENPNVGRVNRDDLRSMIFNGQWTGEREKVIMECERAIASILQNHAHHVVVDDTNLSMNTVRWWQKFAEDSNTDIHEIAVETDVQDCVDNDWDRTDKEPVGQAVINNFALRNNMIQWSGKPIVIFDLDGTLADLSHRLPFIKCIPKMWDSFFALCRWDGVHRHVKLWMDKLADDHEIVIVSGRPMDKCGVNTQTWLYENQIPYSYLFMRKGGDRRDDVEVKAEILSFLPKDKIEFAVDDRPRVVRMWREHGVKVYDVGHGKEF